MSESENQLKNHFSNFEPEVDDLTIDNNWQKLRSHLPITKTPTNASLSKSLMGFKTMLGISLTTITIVSGCYVYSALTKEKQINPSSYTVTSSNHTNTFENSKKITKENENHIKSVASINNAIAPVDSQVDLTSTSKKELITEKKQVTSNLLNESKSNVKSAETTNSERQKTKEISSNADDITKNKKSPSNLVNAKDDIEKTTPELEKNSELASSITKQEKEIAKQKTLDLPKNIKKNQVLDKPIATSNSKSNKTFDVSTKDKSHSIQKDVATTQPPHALDLSSTRLPMIEYFNSYKDSTYPEIIATKLLEVKTNTVIPKASSKKANLSIELFAGQNFPINPIVTYTNSEEQKASTYNQLPNNSNAPVGYTAQASAPQPIFNVSPKNYAFGAALRYQLSNNILLIGQINYAQNKMDFKTQQEEKIILTRYVYYNYFYDPKTYKDSVKIVDSTRYYKAYNHNYSLNSTHFINYSFGIGYTIPIKSKFFIDAQVLFNIQYTRYNLQKTSQLDSNIVVDKPLPASYYLLSGNAYPSPNIVADAPKPKTSQYTSFGLMPSLTLGYNINKKFAIIIKPSYCFALNKNTINIDDLTLKISQNNLFLHLGLKFKF